MGMPFSKRTKSEDEMIKVPKGAKAPPDGQPLVWEFKTYVNGRKLRSTKVIPVVNPKIPEMNYKYIEVLPEDPNRYYEELIHKFESPVRTTIYSLSFIFLALHLLHGFSSSFKTIVVEDVCKTRANNTLNSKI